MWVVACAALALHTARASAQVADTTMWVTNGIVRSMLRSGNTLYVGGAFTEVGPATGGGLPLDPDTGAPSGAFPKVAGTVYAVVPDGAGGWFIGGEFTSVGGFARSNLAHVLADGSVSGWNPAPDGGVTALLVNGSTLYVAGGFYTIGGYLRVGIAAVDDVTGAVTPWAPASDGSVHTMALVGSTLYVGGSFTNIGGAPRTGVAALDVASGAATQWDPQLGVVDIVTAIAVSGSKVYIGGDFQPGDGTRHYAYAIDITSGNVIGAWNPDPDAIVFAIAVRGSTVYLGGAFSSLGAGAVARTGLAAVDSTTGAATAWNPQADYWVYRLAISALDHAPFTVTVYAAGWFTHMGGQPRKRLGAVDASTGLATAWNPAAGDAAYALAIAGSKIFAGGQFTLLSAQGRSGIAAFDLTTGHATAWNPGAGGNAKPEVDALAMYGPTLFAGGSFTGIGGAARNYLAALDTSTGLATPWNPDLGPVVTDTHVWALAVHAAPTAPFTVSIYAGGEFGTVGGITRSNIAAIDAGTGGATSWNPNANGTVRCMTVRVSGIQQVPTVYLGGDFTAVGGQSRNHVAAIDVNGAATSWNPNASGPVYALASFGGSMLAGGEIGTIGGQSRRGLAALDLASGAATAWNPDVAGFVYSIAADGSTVYAGGGFASVGGQPRDCLAAVDGTSGAPLDWLANVPATGVSTRLMFALAPGDSKVYAGGQFTHIDTAPQSYLAAIGGFGAAGVATQFTARPPALACAPNPARARTSVAFTLSRGGPVRLGLFDTAGRRVATLLDGEVLGPGRHEITFSADALEPGLYLARLETEEQYMSGKLLVAR